MKLKCEGYIGEVNFACDGKGARISFTLMPTTNYMIDIGTNESKKPLTVLVDCDEKPEDAKLVKCDQQFGLAQSLMPLEVLLSIKQNRSKVRVIVSCTHKAYKVSEIVVFQ